VQSIRSLPVTLAIGLSVAGTILFGAVFPGTELLSSRAEVATGIEQRMFDNQAAATHLPTELRTE